jgi:FtsZ-binding cell division protein ZapB
MREAIALLSKQERMKVELREENAALRNEAIGLKSQVEGLDIECQSLVKQLNIY